MFVGGSSLKCTFRGDEIRLASEHFSGYLGGGALQVRPRLYCLLYELAFHSRGPFCCGSGFLCPPERLFVLEK